LNKGERPLSAPQNVNKLLDQGKIIIIITIFF
ncbi:hypothetical protein T4A_12850, partial [Trichinella pseudospiralis]